MTSTYLKSLIPGDLVDAFEFAVDRPVDRLTLVRTVGRVHAAIFASSFETFNLALHEVARLRVPVVLSRIPAFVEAFNGTAARMFTPDDPASLADALTDALADRAWASGIRRDGYPLAYADAAAPYQFYDTGPGSAIDEVRHPKSVSRVSVLAAQIAADEQAFELPPTASTESPHR